MNEHILDHQKFVWKVVNKYNIDMRDDLFQVGMIGLLKASEKFDSTKEIKFLSYASDWIHAEIHTYIKNNVSSVKLGTTRNSRSLYTDMKKATKSLHKQNKEANSVNIAAELNVDVAEVEAFYSSSLNDRISDTESSVEKIELLVDTSPNPEEITIENLTQEKYNRIYEKVKSQLSERELFVLSEMILIEDHPGQVHIRMGVSRQRAHQIKTKTLEKVHELFKKYLIEEMN